jgi:hypothetical protein
MENMGSVLDFIMVDEKIYLCSTRLVESSAYIALGSNLGDRELNMLRAIAEIGRLPGSKIRAISAYYDTQPVGPVEQDNFLNCVLRLETALPPVELLNELQRIETGVFKRKKRFNGVLAPWIWTFFFTIMSPWRKTTSQFPILACMNDASSSHRWPK